MVITKMSGEDNSGQRDSVQKAIARIRGMQSVLDLTYKSLLQNRSSNFANAPLKQNQSQFIESKMIRFLAKQLKEKHTELEALIEPAFRPSVEKEFDDLISLETFLVLAELERRDIDAMLNPNLSLSMDRLYQASEEQLVSTFEDLRTTEISQKRVKNRLVDLKEAYANTERFSSVSTPYDDDFPRSRRTDYSILCTPPTTPPVSQSRLHQPYESGSVESMPAAVRKNVWLTSKKQTSLDGHPMMLSTPPPPANLAHYRSSEQINQAQLAVPRARPGHMRTRSLGNDFILSITNGVGGSSGASVGSSNEQEVPNSAYSPLQSPTPLSEVRRSVKQRSPNVMVKQASLGTYQESSRPTYEYNKPDEFGDSSSLCFYSNSYSDGDEDLVTSKAQSVPRLSSLSVSAEHNPREAFTRSMSEVLPSDRHPPAITTPTSPRSYGANTPLGLVGHRIPHRFSSRSVFHSALCDFCKKTMLFGLRCKLCKYKCHKNCQKKVPASCGLTPALETAFIKMMCPSPAPSMDSLHIHDTVKDTAKNSYGPSGMNKKYDVIAGLQNTMSVIPNPAHLTSPSSSSLSSASLSPATPISPHDKNHFLYSTSSEKGSTLDESSEQESEMRDSDNSSSIAHSHGSCSLDDISDLQRLEGQVKRGPRPSPQIVSVGSLTDLHRPKVSVFVTGEDSSYASLRGSSPSLIHTSGSSMATSTLTSGSTGFYGSELGSTTNTLVNSVCSENHVEAIGDGEEGYNLIDGPSNPQYQREWEIPYHSLTNLSLISEDGVTGVQTLRGYWHGEVMIKKFPAPNATAQQLDRFVTDVAALKHCRHENVLLFMAICTQPPDLAVITSDFNGYSLFKHIHVFGATFQGRQAHQIIKQVAQGMGYLHDKGIVHKDLTSSHILLEDKDRDQKVVITDVGFNLVTDCQLFPGMKGKLMVPHGWMNYQAPEIVKVLSPFQMCDQFYTPQSDIYAFGILWYELLSGNCPFADYEPEQIIYLVGSGTTPKTNKLTCYQTVKDIITKCLRREPEKRIPFANVLEDLKKRMPVIRIASHPTKLSKSLESVCH